MESGATDGENKINDSEAMTKGKRLVPAYFLVDDLS